MNEYRSCPLYFSSVKNRIMAVDIQINVKNLGAIERDFWPEKVEQALDNSIKKAIITLDDTARQETPVWVSGILRSGFKEEFWHFYWRLFNPTDYAMYVHEWTWPHRAPFWAIQQRANFKWLPAWAVRTSIWMKGTKANPFMDRAVEQTDNKIDSIFQWEIDKLVLQLNS